MRIAEWTMMAGLVLVSTAGAASAQVSEDTARVAKELVDVLTPQAEGFNPRYMAAADPDNADRFVAAMLIPGVQLVVVAADYEVPVLLRERLLTGKYQDAYIDLSTATEKTSRLTIEDLLADGLAFRPPKGVASGDLIVRNGEQLRLDGQWRKKRMKEDEYRAAFDQARADYVRIIGLLLAQAKQQP